MPNDRDSDIVYFCDESGNLTDRHMAVGGLSVNRDAIPTISRDIRDINPGFKSEIKWANATWRDGKVHEAYIDLLFSLVAQNLVHFHVRFAHLIGRDQVTGQLRRRHDAVSSMYYELLLHRPIRHYGSTARLWIHPDKSHCNAHLHCMIDLLHRDAARQYGRDRIGCIKEITPRDPKDEPILQLLDVTLGALTAYRNQRYLGCQTGQTRRELAEYAFEKTGWRSIHETNQSIRLSVWNVRPGAQRTCAALGTIRGRPVEPGSGYSAPRQMKKYPLSA